MVSFLERVMTDNPALTRIVSIGLFGNLAFILFIIASKMGVIKSIKAGKDGVSLEGAEKKSLDLRFESGSLHNLMNQQIKKADSEMMDYALDRCMKIRRNMTKTLSVTSYCVSSRQALVACMRYPLYETTYRNNFKYALRPENMKFYIERLMKELSFEYDELSSAITVSGCPSNIENVCKALPPFVSIYDGIQQELIQNWAIPVREQQIKTHYKKIEIYKQYALLFEQLGDTIMKRVCEDCLEKNKNYAAILSRKPEVNEL